MGLHNITQNLTLGHWVYMARLTAQQIFISIHVGHNLYIQDDLYWAIFDCVLTITMANECKLLLCNGL